MLTGCTVAIAETGTLVLCGGPLEGPRVLTLVPDFHLCVVYAQQIVEWKRDVVVLLLDPSSNNHREVDNITGLRGRNLATSTEPSPSPTLPPPNATDRGIRRTSGVA